MEMGIFTGVFSKSILWIIQVPAVFGDRQQWPQEDAVCVQSCEYNFAI